MAKKKTQKKTATEAAVEKTRIALKVDGKDAFETLEQLISAYAEATMQDSWKGGGDPADIPLLEKELELAQLRLTTHIEKMKQELE